MVWVPYLDQGLLRTSETGAYVRWSQVELNSVALSVLERDKGADV
jgi:hypothetical protein